MGSLSGSARFTSLLADYGKRSTFAADRLFWAHGRAAAREPFAADSVQ